jgi:uncharacterized membrane protein
MKGTSLFRLSVFSILSVFGLRSLEAQVITAPWSETFSGVQVGSPQFNVGSTIPAGWSRNPLPAGGFASSTYSWGGGLGATHSRNFGDATGPALTIPLV